MRYGLIGLSCAFGVTVGSLLLRAQSAVAQTTLSSETAANLYTPNAPIEQARLFDRPAGTATTGITADGTTLPDAGSTPSDDDGFGAQQILKSHERVREFAVSGDATVFYTSNVALTRQGAVTQTLSLAPGH